MRLQALAGLGLLLFPRAAVAAKKEAEGDGVPMVNTKGFDAVLKEHKHVLVQFYAPWCGHCKQLAPEYAKAAVQLKAGDPPVHVIKVDAMSETQLAEKHKVSGYPQIMFFSGAKVAEYTGVRTSDNLVRWATKRAAGPAVTLKDAAALQAFLQENPLAMVSKEQSTIFEEASLELDDVAFAYYSGSDSAGVSMHFPHDEKVADFKGSSAKELISFARERRLPDVSPFDGNVSAELFGDQLDRPILFLFCDENSKSGKDAVQALRPSAPSLRKSFVISTVGLATDENIEGRLQEFIGVANAMYPIAVIVKDPLGPVKKWQSGDVSAASFASLGADFAAGKLKQFIKSEPVPAKDHGPVHTLVGKTMKDAVLDNSKHVLVEVYAPWCGHSKRLEPIWARLAAQFADHKEIMIAKIDGTTNDLYGMEIDTFPMIRLWPKGQKDKTVDYGEDDEKELGPLSKWLGKHTGVDVPQAKLEKGQNEL